jgi:hypothetical protein
LWVEGNHAENSVYRRHTYSINKIQHTQNYNLPTGSMDTNVDINGGVRVSVYCDKKEEYIKRNQYSEIQEYTERNT